jgi:DNA-binding NtrC family response regulator
MQRIRLTRTDGSGNVADYIFDQPVVTLGALDDNDLVLTDDQASRYHARIWRDGDSWLIEDLQSTAGTFVQQVRVKEAFLTSGSAIRLGRTELQFALDGDRSDAPPPQHFSLGQLIGTSEAMRKLLATAARVAPTGSTVVLEGETGSGKDMVARTIHQLSMRSRGPFVVFDCGAVQPNLIESELFGHEKGSFTGALAGRQGLLELAHGGTVFLDEIGELAPELQPKLLRALEQREVRRVGGNRPIKIDVRVIAATHRDLQADVQAGRFREDLFYRLGVVRLKLPPLRERRDDIPLLLQHFLKTAAFNRLGDGPRVRGVTHQAREALQRYDWPGNIRELVNVLERACSLTQSDWIGLEDLPDALSGQGPVRPRQQPHEATAQLPERSGLAMAGATNWAQWTFKEAKEAQLAVFERDYLTQMLTRHYGNLSQAARQADVDRKHFRRLARKYGLLAGKVDDSEDD